MGYIMSDEGFVYNSNGQPIREVFSHNGGNGNHKVRRAPDVAPSGVEEISVLVQQGTPEEIFSCCGEEKVKSMRLKSFPGVKRIGKMKEIPFSCLSGPVVKCINNSLYGSQNLEVCESYKEEDIHQNLIFSIQDGQETRYS